MKNDFAPVGEIINQSLSKNPKYKFAIKCSTLFSFWGDVVGSKFAKFSKPIALNYNKLSVVCKNPTVAQELTMFKADLIKKIQKFALPLNLKVVDFIFTYKNWGDDPEIPEELEDRNFIEFSEEQIQNVELSTTELDLIYENVNSMNFLSNELKEKYYTNIINSLKAQKLRENF